MIESSCPFKARKINSKKQMRGAEENHGDSLTPKEFKGQKIHI
jgi:hypothetical protein